MEADVRALHVVLRVLVIGDLAYGQVVHPGSLYVHGAGLVVLEETNEQHTNRNIRE